MPLYRELYADCASGGRHAGKRDGESLFCMFRNLGRRNGEAACFAGVAGTGHGIAVIAGFQIIGVTGHDSLKSAVRASDRYRCVCGNY
ncbi:hypothetical protein SDC9_105441 [bioreactor metagenome]|uniref:Uncharacterized protein n=1 Tax=bioreactor metagenome TaxID=1076179 RepID=A0A645AZN3_9ZZZZ